MVRIYRFRDANPSAPSTNDLIRSRLFINCFLELTGGRPFDIDAVCRSDGAIFVAEFKRKYPSSSDAFGIDEHLVNLAGMLPHVHSLYHFVLNDLAGKTGKGKDPTEGLVDACNEGSNFKWLGIHLHPRLRERYSTKMNTQGADSGQKGGAREQVSIPRSEFIRLPNAANIIESRTLRTR